MMFLKIIVFKYISVPKKDYCDNFLLYFIVEYKSLLLILEIVLFRY